MALSKEEKKSIGKRIRKIRLEKGMTTKEFGQLFNATDSNVSSWEKGRTSPNPERLNLIAKIGNVTIDELLKGSKIEYALFLCNSLIQNKLTLSFSDKTLIEKYSNQFIDYIRNALNSTDISESTYNEIAEFVITKFNEFLSTPTSTKKLINSVIRVNQNEINKIYDFISSSNTVENNLSVSSVEEIDKNIAKKIIEILDNSNLELNKLKNELKQ
jgi:putative DNA-binding phage protein